ncbi:hypothetical protein RhiirC2_779506 [Rhizophagus irregularis]|uniref:Uncharacterized protein n=1 Tax=Rhizophagus irregularis TaxID=588596 RepID=A0A2N1N9R3_9GLOM|nr:hypothetical protein RhiirC2_779506 [Rhizophagus irregularis]
MTGILRHNANKGCHTCKTTKESLSAHNQNIVATLRYHHITDKEISKISHETIMSRRDQLCTEYEENDNFIEIWKNFEIPKRWSHLPNLITHYNSFIMLDLLRLAMIIPFLLNQFLKKLSIKRNETAMIQQRIDTFQVNSVPKIIISSDGGIDPRFNRSCIGFTNSNFGQLFLNWYVTEDKYLTEAIIEQNQDDNNDTKIISPVNFISNISLKKRISKQKHDKLLLTLHNFKTELFLFYMDMKFEAALINSSISLYKFASYMIKENDILLKVYLHLRLLAETCLA